MRCEISEQPSYTLLTIDGSMADDYLREIRNAFDKGIGQDKHIIVNMTDISFISSSGLGLLFNSNSRLKAKNKKLIVFGPRDEIRRLFSVTRIENHIVICDTYDDAIVFVG